MLRRILCLLLFLGSLSVMAQLQVGKLKKQLHETKASSHILSEIAKAYSTSNPDSALKYAAWATTLKPNAQERITINAAQGEAYVAQGKVQEALKHFKEAHQWAVKQADKNEQYNQLCSMGICYSRLQKFDEASKCYEQVIDYGIHYNRMLAFSGYQNYAALCSRVGRVADTEKLLRNALKYEDATESALRVSVYAGLGTILTAYPSKFSEAESFLKKGIEIAQQSKEPLAEASCLSPLITLLTQQPPRYGEIPNLIKRTDQIVTKLAPNGSERMQLEHAKANYYFVTRQWAQALASALVLYENGPAVSSERDKVLLMVARAYEGVGQTAKACYFYREAYYVGDSIQQIQIQQQSSDAAARYDTKEKEFKILQLQSKAAADEVKQWRMGVSLIGSCLFILIGFVAVLMYHRHQRNKMLLVKAQKYIDGIETERKRLAQELHDGVCNDLLVTEMRMLSSKNVDEAVAQLHSVRNDIREISHNLMPPNMQYASLDQMLSALCYKLTEANDYKVLLEVEQDIDWAKMEQDKALQLYRIVQEWITNLIKHGHSQSISISLHKEDECVVLQLRDDSQVCKLKEDAVSSSANYGIGLQSIDERLKRIDAKAQRISSPDGVQTISIKCKM